MKALGLGAFVKHLVTLVVISPIAIVPLLMGTTSCSIATENPDLGDLPDQKSFVESKVSLFMERRCGTLDCHGQPGRPLRIYSDWGLRLKPRDDGSRNGAATTSDEQRANYLSVVGLEPEAMETCFRTKGADKANFQLLLKPISLENGGIRHKGGPVLRPDNQDSGWQCLYGWVSGEVNKAECEKAADLLKE
jgi:hypothetical protein